MSHSRMNHSVASYGNFMIIVGGHTLVNMVPKDVPSAVCYRIDSEGREEYESLNLGTNKLGIGLAMVGDLKALEKINQKRNSSEISSSTFSDPIKTELTSRNTGTNVLSLVSWGNLCWKHWVVNFENDWLWLFFQFISLSTNN